MPNKWEDKYPLNTFKGETRIELIDFIQELLDEETKLEVCPMCNESMVDYVEGRPQGYSNWLSEGEKYGYIKYYLEQIRNGEACANCGESKCLEDE
jgi:hypothetical protein